MLTVGRPGAVLPAKIVVVTRQSNCHLILNTLTRAQRLAASVVRQLCIFPRKVFAVRIVLNALRHQWFGSC